MSDIRDYTLTIDPVGKFRLIMGDRVDFGGPNSPRRSGLIQLRGELSRHAATIERQKGAYRLTRQPNEEITYIDHEEWELTPGLKLSLNVPSKLTQTMMISVSPTSRMMDRFSRVIFMDHFMLLGQGPRVHVQHQCFEQLSAIVSRNDHLEFVSPIKMDSRQKNLQGTPLTIGQKIQTGDCIFHLEKTERAH